MHLAQYSPFFQHLFNFFLVFSSNIPVSSVFEDKIIVNLNLRDGDKPIALSKENGSDIKTFGSPKNAPQLRLGSFFGASVRGIEQDGRPQAAKNNPADCFLVRGRWTHGSPESTTSFEVVLFSLYLLFNRCRA